MCAFVRVFGTNLVTRSYLVPSYELLNVHLLSQESPVADTGEAQGRER